MLVASKEQTVGVADEELSRMGRVTLQGTEP